jgi:catechol 2,3-dioxygenase-like lactoylglutathione lyase family enzyme
MNVWQIDHVCRVVADLDRYLKDSFLPAPGPTVYDVLQDADVCFIDLGGGQPRLELVQPRSPQSRIHRAAQQIPNNLHHVCYRVPDVAEAQDRIKRYGMIPIWGPVPAVALNGQPVLFAYSRNREIVEFVCGKAV